MKTGEFQHHFATNSPDLALFGRVGREMGESRGSCIDKRSLLI